MEVKLEQRLDQKDIEILIRFASRNRTVRKLEEMLKSFDKTIRCEAEDVETWVSVSDIFYAESVDKHTYVYCEEKVYRCGLPLYRLLEELVGSGFVQVSKSCILNLHVLESIRPLANSRMEASLSNGERVYVTRKYVAEIKRKLLERR